jgi:hypothetical protein
MQCDMKVDIETNKFLWEVVANPIRANSAITRMENPKMTGQLLKVQRFQAFGLEAPRSKSAAGENAALMLVLRTKALGHICK